ncbi:MAG: hypothetical protein FK734_18610 [Asgard group archaeon]|nr:hypothetical protein [Asgard group archaeon]
MILKIKRVIGVALITITLFSMLFPLTFSISREQGLYINQESDIKYIESAEINIDEDSDFISYGFSGNGSVINPFLISELDIDTELVAAIAIQYTTKYFRIVNCSLKGYRYGIFLYRIQSNTAYIFNNTCQGTNNYALYLSNAPYSKIYNNTFLASGSYGLYATNSEYTEIKDNDFYGTGMRIYYNYYGYYYPQIYDDHYSIVNNFLDGKPILYIKDQENFIFDNSIEYGQVEFIFCKNFVIKDILHINKLTDFIIAQCKNVTIINNVFQYSKAILIQLTPFLKIIGNTFVNNVYGLELSINCSYSEIRNNEFLSTGFSGLYMYKTYLCNISDNLFQNSTERGIYLYSSNANTIYNNTFLENGLYGAYLYGSGRNVIYHNVFIDNGNSPQAYDSNNYNYWCNCSIKQGNYWSDWSGDGPYLIAGYSDYFITYDYCPTFPGAEFPETSCPITTTPYSPSSTPTNETGYTLIALCLIFSVIILVIPITLSRKKKR